MKEDIKKFLLGASILYSLVIITLMGITFIKMDTTIELYDNDVNIEKLNRYKSQLLSLKQNSCTDEMNKLIKYYEKTSYNGNVDLREMYQNLFGDAIVSYYSNIKEKCNISDDTAEEYNLPIKFIAANVQLDEIIEPFYFQYELHIKDDPIRLIGEPDLSTAEYKIMKGMELDIISSLLEIYSKEDIINE